MRPCGPSRSGLPPPRVLARTLTPTPNPTPLLPGNQKKKAEEEAEKARAKAEMLKDDKEQKEMMASGAGAFKNTKKK